MIVSSCPSHQKRKTTESRNPYIYIYVCVCVCVCKSKVKLVTLVEGDQKAPFSLTTTPRCREERYSFPWIALLYPWYVPYNAECLARKRQVPFFESLIWLNLGLNPGLPGHWYIWVCVRVRACVCVYVMDSLIDLDFWRPNSSLKDINNWTAYSSDLFIVVMVCVELATLFKKRIVHFSQRYFLGFEFKVFSFSKTGHTTKARETNLTYYSTHSWELDAHPFAANDSKLFSLPF